MGIAENKKNLDTAGADGQSYGDSYDYDDEVSYYSDS